MIFSLIFLVDEFDTVVGLNYLRGMHLNDSKSPLSSKKDRHENLGMYELHVSFVAPSNSRSFTGASWVSRPSSISLVMHVSRTSHLYWRRHRTKRIVSGRRRSRYYIVLRLAASALSRLKRARNLSGPLWRRRAQMRRDQAGNGKNSHSKERKALEDCVGNMMTVSVYSDF